MATAAKKQPKKKARGSPGATLLDIPVEWGNVTFGDEVCRIGVKVDRQHLTLDGADAHLCGKRLVATIQASAGGGGPDQPAMFDGGVEATASFDVKSFGTSSKRITFVLSTLIKSVDRDALIGFARRNGRLVVDKVEAIPADEAGEADDEGGGDEE